VARPAALRSMALAAAAAAAREFQVLSQLDAFVWTVRRVAELTGPPPAAPAGGDSGSGRYEGWRLLKLTRGAGPQGWKSALLRHPGMAAFRRAFADDMAANLMPAASGG
jgi:hypothetical protein